MGFVLIEYLIILVFFFFVLLEQVSRNADQHPAFFAVYNMETTEIAAFYQVIL